MRLIGFVLVALTVWHATAVAQQPPPKAQPAPPPALDPARNRVDDLLIRWEGEMKKVQSLSAQCTRLEENKTFKYTDVYQGEAKYMKASDGGRVTNLAMLEMRKKANQAKPDKQEVWEKFVCNGTLLYQYVPSQKEIRVHQLPPPKDGQVAEDNFLSFLFGMKAAEAKKRYDLKFVKEDQYYYYIEVFPRFDPDKADFQKARLVLNKDSFLPRQLWFEQPSGDTVTWDVPKLDLNAPLKRQEFDRPAVPQGWKQVQAPVAKAGDAPPRVIRQGDK
jgi:TIGR03009 family protein